MIWSRRWGSLSIAAWVPGSGSRAARGGEGRRPAHARRVGDARRPRRDGLRVDQPGREVPLHRLVEVGDGHRLRPRPGERQARAPGRRSPPTISLPARTSLALSPDGRLGMATAFRSRTAVLYLRNAETGELTQADVARDGERGVRMRWPIRGLLAHSKLARRN